MSYFTEAHKNYYKRTFGVTFHKHMTPREVVDIWNSKVPPEVKRCFPELVAAFALLEVALEAEVIAYRLYKTAVQLYYTIKDAIDTATAIITGQVQFPAAKAQKIATDIAIKLEVVAIRAAKEDILPIILNSALKGRCQH